MAEVARLVAKLEANTAGFSRGMDQASRKMQVFADKSSRASKRLKLFSDGLAKLKLPVLALGAAAIKMASDYDKSMSQITGLVGIAKDEVEKMGKSLLKISSATAKGPGELAKALFFVTSAGLRGTEALEALEFSAKAAAAGLGETADVADAVTSAMNAFATAGLSAEDATNILVATVREGKLSADELANSIGAVLPIASEMGVRFDEVGAAIAAMTRLGLNSAESVTALRAVLTTIINPALSAKAELEKVGLSSEGLRKQIKEKGLLSVLTTLREKFEGNAEGLTKVIPNVRALTGFMSLTGDAAEETNAIFERMTDTTGILDDAFATAADTIDFRFNKALTDMKIKALEIRDPLTRLSGQLLPLLSDATSEMKLTVRGINAIKDGVIKATGPTSNWAKAMAELTGNAVPEFWEESSDKVRELAAAIQFTGGAAAATDETLSLMIESLGLGDEEFNEIIASAEDFAKAAGLTAGELDRLIDVLEGLRRIRITDEFEKIKQKTMEVRDAVLDGLDPALRRLVPPDPDVAKGLTKIKTEAEKAADKIKVVQDRIRALTDPVFAAVSAGQAFIEGGIAVEEATPAEAQAAGIEQLQNVEDLLFAMQELDGLSLVGVKSFFFGMADLGKVPLQTVKDMFALIEANQDFAIRGKMLLDMSDLEAALDLLRRSNLNVPTDSDRQRSLIDAITGRADGGFATAGKPYIVGERGPELFTPGRSGTVTPNNQMGNVTNQTFNIGELTEETLEDLQLDLLLVGLTQLSETS